MHRNPSHRDPPDTRRRKGRDSHYQAVRRVPAQGREGRSPFLQQPPGPRRPRAPTLPAAPLASQQIGLLTMGSAILTSLPPWSQPTWIQAHCALSHRRTPREDTWLNLVRPQTHSMERLLGHHPPSIKGQYGPYSLKINFSIVCLQCNFSPGMPGWLSW